MTSPAHLGPRRGVSILGRLKHKLSFLKRNRRHISPGDYRSLFRQYVAVRRDLSGRLSAVIRKYQHGNAQDVLDASKYLDLDAWVLETLGRVFRLELQQGKPRRVLDIGTGCGYFPYLCRSFGHHAECVDLDDEAIYNDAIAALGLTRHVRRIRKFEHLDVEGRFDLITAFMICFNEHKQPALWHIDEWTFFLGDMEARLNPGGAIFLSFNAETPEEPVSRELLRFFESRGAQVEGSTVLLVKR